MPPRKSARPSKAADYSNIGVAGRKTGITLKDTGERDEHGLEPITGIFSSPSKRSAHDSRINGQGNTTLTEDDMEIGQSSIAEPAELLGARKPRLPPPRARSPLKTSLGSSPRKSIGRLSSPPILARGTPNQSFGIIDPSALAEESVADLQPSPDESTLKLPAVTPPSSPSMKTTRNALGMQRSAKRAFDPHVGDEGGRSRKKISSRVQEESSVPSDGPISRINGNQSTLENSSRPSSQILAKSTRKAPGKTPADAIVEIKKRRRGRPKKSEAILEDTSHTKPSGTTKAEFVADTDAANAQLLGSYDLDEPGLSQPSINNELPQKDKDAIDSSKPGETAAKAKSTGKSSKGSKTKKPPRPSERNPNALITSSKGHENSRSKAAVPAAASLFKEPEKPKPRSLLLLRSETPSDIARYTRSGRPSVKPIAFWRNERLVFGGAKSDGQRLSLPGLHEVIRTEEIEIQSSRPRRSKKPIKRRHPEAIPEDTDENIEAWEEESGILEGEVMQWDAATERGLEDSLERTDLAMAPKGISRITKPVKNLTFNFSKLVSLPFFHCGVVDLPARGEKRIKNSRRNHMVFCVFSGRVEVDVSGNRFSIGRGGMWQVPRGNFYGVKNLYETPVRLFFAQGSYMLEDEAEFLEGSGEGAGMGMGMGMSEEGKSMLDGPN